MQRAYKLTYEGTWVVQGTLVITVQARDVEQASTHGEAVLKRILVGSAWKEFRLIAAVPSEG